MIERTFDYRIVKKMCNGFPIISNDVIYLIENDDVLWGLHPFKDGYMINNNDYCPTKGKQVKQSVNRAFDWIFENTDASAIYGQIHKDNKPSRFMASHSGMKRDFEQDNYIFYKVTKNVKNKAA